MSSSKTKKAEMVDAAFGVVDAWGIVAEVDGDRVLFIRHTRTTEQDAIVAARKHKWFNGFETTPLIVADARAWKAVPLQSPKRKKRASK